MPVHPLCSQHTDPRPEEGAALTQLRSLPGSKPRTPRGGGGRGRWPSPLTPGQGGLGVQATARSVSARLSQPGPAGSGRLLNKEAGGQWPLNWAGALAHG